MVCYSDPRAFPPNCKVILPTAPVKPVTCNNGSKSTSWYDVVTFNPKDKLTGEMMSIQDMRAKNYNQEDLKESAALISELLDKEVEALGDPTKVFLGGLSQGCATVLATFLTYKGGQLGGIFALIGVHSFEADWEDIDLDQKRKTPIMLYNGDKDPFFPIQLAQDSYAEFTEKQLNFQLKIEPGLKHTVSQGAVQEIAAFFQPLMK